MYQPGSERRKARNPLADDLKFIVYRIICCFLEIFKHNIFFMLYIGPHEEIHKFVKLGYKYLL